MDNPNFRREGPLRIHDKMYKIFTYQHENILKKEYPLIDKMKFYSTLEGFDYNGDYFLEYDFSEESIDSSPHQLFSTLVPSNVERLEVLEAKAIESDLDDLVKNLKQSFHLIMYGLDAEKFSNHELVEEIYQEMKASLGKFNKEDIILLDERSVISKLFNLLEYVLDSNPNFFSYDKFNQFGRIALLKFKTEKDALKVYLEKVRINLPLIQGKKGMPMCVAGQLLRNFMDSEYY